MSLPRACSPFVLRSLLGSGCDPSSSIQPLSIKSSTPSAYGRHRVVSKNSRSSCGCRSLTVSIYRGFSKRRSPTPKIGEHHLVSESTIEPPEYVQEQLIKNIHDFVVVVVDFHFQVQTSILGKVSVGVRVLCPEDRPDLVHPPHITRNAHLFSELRTLDTVCERRSGGIWKGSRPERDKQVDGSNPL